MELSGLEGTETDNRMNDAHEPLHYHALLFAA